MTIRIEIDGNEVTLYGTTKGNPVDEKARQYSAWRWSGRARAFVLPRNLNPGTRERNIRSLVASYKAAGIEVEVENTGVVLSVAEEREQAEQRLAERAERYENRAERRSAEATGRFATVDGILEHIPPGQPVLVGHHSEGRHRRALDKVDTNMRKGIEAEREAAQAAERAENIKRSLANGTPTPTLRRRIAKTETEIRDLDRRLNGTSAATISRKPAEGEYRERLLGLRAREQEALDLDQAELARRAEEDGVKVWGPEDFVKGDEVAYWGGWAVVQRVNKKSLTVPSGYSWTNTVSYDKVTARRRDGEITR